MTTTVLHTTININVKIQFFPESKLKKIYSAETINWEHRFKLSQIPSSKVVVVSRNFYNNQQRKS